ncbi:MAG: LysR family transcriptional regulator [Wenzhouxiangella sp.]|nr:MAG: LysR family transcriptional regulator [Wenzhouxiangella sp.]
MTLPEVDGRFWLSIDGHSFAGSGRITLLEKIAATGSISAAARAMGMSYKAAWDAIDAMNNLADEPLLLRQAGGQHGGGTVLTRHGVQVIEQYRAAETVHRRFLAELAERAGDMGNVWSLMRTLSMQTSARNHLVGTVRELRAGAISDEVVIDIGHGLEVVSSVTRQSSGDLGLDRPGRRVHVLIKAPFVVLSATLDGARYSAANQFPGSVESLLEGEANCEVRVAIGNGRTLTALASREAFSEDWLAPGSPVIALVNAAHVVLATSD